jgi:Tfp pilus assembly protein PilV
VSRIFGLAPACAVSEGGFTLIEVLVSSLMLAVIAIGTLSAFDAAGRLSSDEQHRSQANDLAQQDQDRLRSMTVAQLSSLNQTQTVTLGANTFTITSTGQFVSDSTDTSSCNASTGGADYIKTTSTVTWPGIGSRPAVVAESEITPPIGGNLVVKVVDSQGNPVPNMSVTGTGVSPVSSTTGTDGCSIFGGLNAGAENVSVSQAGYVDKDGNTSPPASQQATTIVAAATARKSFQFDRAGQITATFDTKYGGSVHSSSADMVAMFNNNMTLPSFRWAGTLSNYQSTQTATGMFPFTSAYTVYAGSCPGDAPSQNGQSSDPSVVVPAGGNAPLLLHLPAILLSVYSGTPSVPGTPLLVSKPHVILTDQNCGGSPPTQGGTPAIKHVPTTTATGSLADPGQPYGTYTLCADNGAKYAQATVTNKDPVNGVSVPLYLGSGTSGKCT